MKINSGEYYLTVSCNENHQLWANVCDDKIWESRIVTLLGLSIKNEFKIEKLISNIFTKSQRKPNVLIKISKYLYF